MKILFSMPVVLAGVYLSMRMLAAIHRVVDLWYTIATAWPRVLRSLAGWTAATVAIAVVARPPWRGVFLWSVGGYAVFYVVVVLYLSHVVLARVGARIGSE